MKKRYIWIIIIAVLVIGYLLYEMIALEILTNNKELKLIKRLEVPNRNYKVGIYRVPSDATFQGGISVYFEGEDKMEES